MNGRQKQNKSYNVQLNYNLTKRTQHQQWRPIRLLVLLFVTTLYVTQVFLLLLSIVLLLLLSLSLFAFVSYSLLLICQLFGYSTDCECAINSVSVKNVNKFVWLWCHVALLFNFKITFYPLEFSQTVARFVDKTSMTCHKLSPWIVVVSLRRWSCDFKYIVTHKTYWTQLHV